MVLSFSFSGPYAGPADREIPPGNGPAAYRCPGRKPHLDRGLCDGDDRRGGESEADPSAIYRGLLSRQVSLLRRCIDYEGSSHAIQTIYYLDSHAPCHEYGDLRWS